MPWETGNRLRSFLNSKQAQREGMCLAILPTMGNYSSPRPRRPEGGRDGGRDIETYFNGTILTWGAVGFLNDAGSCEPDRTQAQKKFRDDLGAALKNHPTLPGFIFFTNVDLTPAQVKDLKQYAYARNVSHVEVFDFNRLRDALDRPAGFIARLQYLEIEMSKEEQLGLVRDFGQELQKTMNSGFSRMESSLERLEKFLDIRRPLNHIALVYALDQRLADIAASPQTIVTFIQGLWPTGTQGIILSARAQQQTANDAVVAALESWRIAGRENGGKTIFSPKEHLHFTGTQTQNGTNVATSYNLLFSAGGGSLHLADITSISVAIFASPSVASHITRFQLDMNGYTILGRDRMYEEDGNGSLPCVPEELAKEDLRHVLTSAHSISHNDLRRSGLSFSQS